MLACGEQIRPVYMMASSVKQESRGFSHVRFKMKSTVGKIKRENDIKSAHFNEK